MDEQLPWAPPEGPRDEGSSLAGPIGVVGVFAALSEVAAIAAATVTAGGIRWAMTLFAVLFPVYVASAFFWILWHKHHVLYPPQDAGGEPGVDGDAPAKPRHCAPPSNADVTSTTVAEAVRASLTSVETVRALACVLAAPLDAAQAEQSDERLSRALHAVADRAIEEIRSRTELVVRPGELRAPTAAEAWRVVYASVPTVCELLDAIAERLAGAPADSARGRRSAGDTAEAWRREYGRSWVLRDERTGRLFLEMGPRWARVQRRPDGHADRFDTRPLKEVGIEPGVELEGVVLNSETLPRPSPSP